MKIKINKSQSPTISTSSILLAFLYALRYTQNDKNSNVLIAYQETKAGTQNITYMQHS